MVAQDQEPDHRKISIFILNMITVKIILNMELSIKKSVLTISDVS